MSLPVMNPPLVPATAYVRAQRARSLIRDGIRRTFDDQKLDALVTPKSRCRRCRSTCSRST